MPLDDLVVGNESFRVEWVQEFLIEEVSGPGVERLAQVGATGYFGSITAEALRDYQTTVGIPATGNYDGLTRLAIFLFDL